MLGSQLKFYHAKDLVAKSWTKNVSKDLARQM
jgi:hypothetical protein